MRADRGGVQRGPVRGAGPCGDRRSARPREDADRGGRNRALPARRADGARPAPARGARPARGTGARAGRGGPCRAARPALAGDGGRGASERPQADRAGAGAGAGRHGPARCVRSAVVRGAAAAHRAVRDHHGPRGARGPGSRPESARCSPAGRSRRSSARSSGAHRARRARRSASRRSPLIWPARRVWRRARADRARAPRIRAPPAHVDAQAVRRGDDRPHRPVRARGGAADPGAPRIG